MVLRGDLPRGMQFAHCIHAAGESSPGKLSPGTYAIALKVPNEQALRELAEKLESRGIEHRLVTESQSPYTGQAMAIGVTPMPRMELRRHFSSLPLMR